MILSNSFSIIDVFPAAPRRPGPMDRLAAGLRAVAGMLARLNGGERDARELSAAMRREIGLCDVRERTDAGMAGSSTIRHVFSVAAIAAVIAAGAAGQAHAGVRLNGIDLNGIAFQGVRLNGVSPNGGIDLDTLPSVRGITLPSGITFTAE